MRTVIGVDYGTLSARAILVDVENGNILYTHQVTYPHGVISGDYADAQDYDDALTELLSVMGGTPWHDSICGICVDATSLTMVSLSSNGIPLSLEDEWKDNPDAQIRLWKHHAAQQQADDALQLAQKMGESFLKRTGGSLSAEWMLPKLIHCRDKAPEVYEKTDIAFDLCEYLTYRLTGKVIRSSGSMGFKCLWDRDNGFPSDEYLNRIRKNFAGEYKKLLRGTVLCPGEAAGMIREDVAEKVNLPKDIIVSTGALDGHTSLVALGALTENEGALVIGTSNVLTVQTNELREIPGICGVAKDGFFRGLYGYDSGQSCTGDMLSWYVNNMVPACVFNAAQEQKTDIHTYLCSLISQPWKNSVITADWWNGSRNTPCDLHLTGMMKGLTLSTAPQDIYLSMLQSIVCGTRNVIDRYAEYGVQIKRLTVSGGIAQKNTLLMQEYANILHMPVYVGKIAEGPAFGAAMLAAVAAGIYPDVMEAWKHMGVKDFTEYLPDTTHRDEYERLYQNNKAFRSAGNPVSLDKEYKL